MSLFRVLRAGALALTLTLVPGAAQAESLRQALEFAYLNNPAIMSALLSIKMSAEDVALRKSGKLPTIALNGSFTGAFSAPGGGSVELSRSHRLSLSYQQTLFDNFKTESEIEQARAFVELSKFALRSAEQNVLLAVATAYMSVVRDTQLVAMRQENVSFFQAQLESADSRLRLGEGTQIDVSQSTTRLAAATAFYRAAIANLQISQASYERWVGHKPRNLTSGFNFNGSLPRSVDAALALSESNHPAILTARAAIRATQAGSDAARAAFGPTLSLIGSLCGAGCFAVDPDQGGFTGSVTLQLTVPIYAGGAQGEPWPDPE
jgi:outer membrane protein